MSYIAICNIAINIAFIEGSKFRMPYYQKMLDFHRSGQVELCVLHMYMYIRPVSLGNAHLTISVYTLYMYVYVGLSGGY